jgi:hypothetical protein
MLYVIDAAALHGAEELRHELGQPLVVTALRSVSEPGHPHAGLEEGNHPIAATVHFDAKNLQPGDGSFGRRGLRQRREGKQSQGLEKGSPRWDHA